ncbi:dTMP kinase [bacterium]|nr:dTMP kinase [bacterium]
MTSFFVTFEGIDYSGKSLQSKLLCERLQSDHRAVLLLRDPGATRISEKIRSLLLDKTLDEMSAVTELLLYEAARSQMVEQLIRPALASGQTVICDRFYDSTTAYQGFARGLDLGLVQSANRIGSCGLVPGHTFLLDLEPAAALARKKISGREADRIEQEGLAFQSRVREGYLQTAAMEPGRFTVLDAQADSEELHQTIWSVIIQKFGE